MSYANIFSYSVGWLLVLLIVSFAVQKLLFWWSPNSSCLLLFPLPLETCLARRCSGWGQRVSCLCSPLGSWWFPISHLSLLSILNWSSFIFLYVTIQFSQHHLLKRLSFFHWIFFPALLKMSWPYSCGAISGFSTVFHWSMCLFLWAWTRDF